MPDQNWCAVIDIRLHVLQLDKLLNSLAELRSTAGAEEEDEEEFEDGEWVWWRADDTVNIGLPGAKILSEYNEHPDAKAVQQHSEQDNVRCSEVTVSQQQESCTGQVSRYNLQSGAQSNEANELSSKAVVGWFNNENEQGESVERLSSSNNTNALKIKASEVGNESNSTSPVPTVKEPLHG
ncbi:hypothetical protein CEUSTIGMA_g3462.t1 [Chlamydomonas eustigma]|uniref:Uncharacterized protein n=1 Tax=Chlamydomonas eustigma TaxID=1157962 RepID=A0A250WZ95_9CHLO|nr:hypothetical protein CEUSTIGMA_g3462.t1 [Chlamydomonas eustigma]|eukprot:GAX76019.1 hypothetical protein CEUSTIGMA_g3462.t1 [Chlamydomonas eustigma]